MILNDKKTTIAYRCPSCGNAVLGVAGIFSLSADMLKVKCECGKSEMSLVSLRDNQVRVTVPCLVCPRPHTFLLSRNVVFTDGSFVIPCSYSGIDIAFLGDGESVSKALDAQADSLSRILEESGLDSFERLKEDERGEGLELAGVEDVIRFLLVELDEEKKIKCYCRDDGEIPYYNFQILSERVRVFCEVCHGEAELPLGSVSDAEQFLRIDSLELK